MSVKLNWKISKDLSVMVGFYRDAPLYKIELSFDEDPLEFNDMLMGRVVAYSLPRWTALCENQGFGGDAEGATMLLTREPPDNIIEIHAEFRIASEPVNNPKDIEKYMKEYRELINTDFAYRSRHIANMIEPDKSNAPADDRQQ